MAKLSFKYGSMNTGKTTSLIQNAFSYESLGKKVIIVKPAVDTKGKDSIVSRIGISRKADYLISSDDIIIQKLFSVLNGLDCILVDEAQFLERNHIDELFYISKIYDIPVIAYGLRTDFRANAFSGSSRLLEIADSLEEIVTICSCGKKARFNARMVDGEFVNDGESILIDDNSYVQYVPLCGDCFCRKVLNVESKKLVFKK